MQVHQIQIHACGETSGIRYASRFMTVCIHPGKAFSKATQKRIMDFVGEISEISGEVCEARFKVGKMPYSSNDFTV